ncbi:glycosyltransferase family 2 protein [Candidatus Pelagibacter sp.]|nr:glycosyltransferase family 2 protein [Candidatus Pelagibacter sp.]
MINKSNISKGANKAKISVIIPAYNEENTIKEILKRIKRIKINKQIIVINDGSKDNTLNILTKNKKKYFDVLINLKKNKGKGNAIRIGLKKAKGEIIIIQDADLEYNPKDFYNLIKPIMKNKTNVVYGSRVLNKSKRLISNNFTNKLRILANYSLTLFSNLINNQNLTDAHTCYKVFRRSLVPKLSLKEDGFSFCPEITTKLSNLKEDIIEIPISYKGREYNEGKKIKFSDGIEAILVILKYKLI